MLVQLWPENFGKIIRDHPFITSKGMVFQILYNSLIYNLQFYNFILRGVDIIDFTRIFLLHTINHCVTLIICNTFMICSNRNSSEFFLPEYPWHLDTPTRSLDIPLGYGLPWTRFNSKVVLECELLWTYNPDQVF